MTGGCLGDSGPAQLFPHPFHGPSVAWRTAAMVCVVAPLTSPACVTWAGHLTCPRPRPPQDPLPPTAPETAAATSTATAASGGLASAMSAKVSCPPPEPPVLASREPLQGSSFFFSMWASVSPHPSLGSPAPLPAPDPRQASVPPISLMGPQSPRFGTCYHPQSGSWLPSFEAASLDQGPAEPVGQAPSSPCS